MVNARIDITRDLDGQPVVLACFDLAEADVAAAAHAVAAARTERYRNTEMSVELIQPIAMEDGLRFAIREGGRTVGAGRVTKITK